MAVVALVVVVRGVPPDASKAETARVAAAGMTVWTVWTRPCPSEARACVTPVAVLDVSPAEAARVPPDAGVRP
jgi:hypothetical protein